MRVRKHLAQLPCSPPVADNCLTVRADAQAHAKHSASVLIPGWTSQCVMRCAQPALHLLQLPRLV